MYGFVGFFDSPSPWSMIERSCAAVSVLPAVVDREQQSGEHRHARDLIRGPLPSPHDVHIHESPVHFNLGGRPRLINAYTWAGSRTT
jgi:hypothetical protein